MVRITTGAFTEFHRVSLSTEMNWNQENDAFPTLIIWHVPHIENPQLVRFLLLYRSDSGAWRFMSVP